MLAISSPLFSAHGWPLMEDPITIHDHNYLFPSIETSQSFQLPPLQRHAELDQYHCSSTPSTEGGGHATNILKMAKKLSHNASERDRRKKINSLYSSLRSLLPSTDHMKKLSNPATISRILSYIPELQQQVEGLIRKKEELLSAMAGREVQAAEEEKQTKSSASSCSSIVSASKLNQRELAIQISSNVADRNSLSEILLCLEDDGLLLLNASSFQSLDGKIFHNLHIQMDQSKSRIEPEILSNKLLLMFP